MSYIKKEPLLQKAKELLRDDAFGGVRIVREIERAPAEDVVEVVRCKDCKYHRDLDGGVKCERIDGLLMTLPNDFCSYGRRRTDNE